MNDCLFNIMHGIQINYRNFFMRTLAIVALSPFELKPYAPWIIKFIRSRTSIHYKANFQNHLSYLPPIKVLKRTISSADEKGKAAVIDEGTRPLDGQFCKLPLIPPIIALPCIILPQILQTNILKPQLCM